MPGLRVRRVNKIVMLIGVCLPAPGCLIQTGPTARPLGVAVLVIGVLDELPEVG